MVGSRKGVFGKILAVDDDERFLRAFARTAHADSVFLVRRHVN